MNRHIQAILENKLQRTLNLFVGKALEAEYMLFVKIIVISTRFSMRAFNRQKQMWQQFVKAFVVKSQRINPKMLWFGTPFRLTSAEKLIFNFQVYNQFEDFITLTKISLLCFNVPYKITFGVVSIGSTFIPLISMISIQNLLIISIHDVSGSQYFYFYSI